MTASTIVTTQNNHNQCQKYILILMSLQDKLEGNEEAHRLAKIAVI